MADILGFELAAAGPLLAFLCVLAASLGLPVPAMPALILAGSVLAGSQGSATLAAMTFVAALAGALLGDTLWYLAGRRYGYRVLRLLCRVSLSRDTCVRRTESFFERRGVRILLFARFVPGLSVVSVPMSGTAAVPFHAFALHDAAGSGLWIGCGLLLGYLFADQIDAVLLLLQNFGLGFAGVVVVGLAGWIGFRWLRRVQLMRQLHMSRMSVDELYALMAAGPAPVIIDVRSRDHRRLDPYVIPGSRAVELDALDAQLLDLARKDPVVIYCSCPNEISAAILARRMRRLGFTDVRPLLGGLDAWREAGWELHPVSFDEEAGVTGIAVRP